MTEFAPAGVAVALADALAVGVGEAAVVPLGLTEPLGVGAGESPFGVHAASDTHSSGTTGRNSIGILGAIMSRAVL